MPILNYTIQIHLQAPPKPIEGTPCNGCGVCCLVEPCPLGVVLSGRRRGACDALLWSDTALQYRCGAISAPKDVLNRVMPFGFQAIAVIGLSPIMARLAKRWVAAGQGCDSALEVTAPIDLTPPSSISLAISSEFAELPALHPLLPTKPHDQPTSAS